MPCHVHWEQQGEPWPKGGWWPPDYEFNCWFWKDKDEARKPEWEDHQSVKKGLQEVLFRRVGVAHGV